LYSRYSSGLKPNSIPTIVAIISKRQADRLDLNICLIPIGI
jgi:hypothetical protein